MLTPNLHVTFTLDHATAELLVADDTVPMRLKWHEFPDAFARYVGHLSNGMVQLVPSENGDAPLRLTEKILTPTEANDDDIRLGHNF